MLDIKVANVMKAVTAKVFMSGRSQAVRIPAEYRFLSSEVSIRRDTMSGDLILSEGPGTWEQVLAAINEAGVPDDFLADRAQDIPQKRPAL